MNLFSETRRNRLLVNTALLVVDVQQGMFSAEDPVDRGEELIGNIKALLDHFRENGGPVFFIQHDGPSGSPLEPGTPGWNLHPALEPGDGERVFRKGFPDSFQETGLKEGLDRWGVKDLVVAGIQTEVCVDTTCRRAFSLGFRVILACDAHSTWDYEGLTADRIIAHHNRTLRWFASVKSTEEIRKEVK